jgi:beta-N-acetylhexosaminidase
MKIKLKLILLGIIVFWFLVGCNQANDENQYETPDIPQLTLLPSTATTPKVTKVPETSVSPKPSSSPKPTSSPEQTKAEEVLLDMTVEEKVGQLFFVRCTEAQALLDLQTYQLGGFILFADYFKNKVETDIKTAIKSYQELSKLPLLLGVDEEGGSVVRVSKYEAFRKKSFESPQTLYHKGGFGGIKEDTIEKADFLLHLGINVNLAPVCDVSTNPDDYIYSRSFGMSAEKTAEYVSTVICQMKEKRVGSVLKHFPGYGNNVDTHTGIAIDERSYESFVNSDYLPFQAGIKAGADSILVSHNIIVSLDEDFPASLSKKVIDRLRHELKFEGVIMTDDLSMDAIKQYTGEEEAAVQAILAGNDMIIATDFAIQIPAVLSAVNNGKISIERLNESVLRILTWKVKLRLL